MRAQKIKVGLLIDSYHIPQWAFEMIKCINNSSSAQVTLVVKKRNAEKKERIFILRKIWLKRRSLLYFLYTKLDVYLTKSSTSAFEIKNLKDIIFCEELQVHTIETKFSDVVLPEDIAKIKNYSVDVFIRLGFKILRGDILKICRLGIWSYHHGDYKLKRGGPAGFWEVFDAEHETGVILQILTEDLDGGKLITESFSSTNRLSVQKNKNNYYWKAAAFIPRKLDELYRTGQDSFLDDIKNLNERTLFYYNRLYKDPANWEVLKGFLKNFLHKAGNKIADLFYFSQWILLFRLESTETISKSFFRYKRIMPPKDRIWADPFVIFRDDKYYIFIEEMLISKNVGFISMIEMDKNGVYEQPKQILKKDYHLSYPFILEEGGVLFMIPETSQNNRIEMYRCTTFPLVWELEKVLINNIRAVDSTVFRYNNTYWIFTNIKNEKNALATDELFLFYSEDLLSGNWISHPQNPIISV